MFRSFRAQLILSFFIVIAAVPILFVGLFYPTVGRYTSAAPGSQSAMQQARVIGNILQEEIASDATASVGDLDHLLRAAARGTTYRFVFLDPGRHVLVDTDAPIGQHRDRPLSVPESDEVLIGSALAAGPGDSQHSRAAVPVRVRGQLVGALLVIRRNPSLSALFAPANLAARSAFGLLIAAIVGLLLSRRLLRPVNQLTKAVEGMAAGDLSQRADVAPGTELGQLAARFNYMAARIEELVTRLSTEHENLRAAHAELADSERRQRELIANVSHELRTPLACIRASTDAILDGVADDDAKRSRCLHTIEEETASLARLVEDILTLSRLDSGQMRLEESPVDVRRLLERCANRFLPRAQNQDVTIASDCPDGLLVTGDEERLAQVVSNLLDNALRHTGAGGSIRLSADADGADVVVRVADTGSGIPAEDLPHVFERLYRVERSRSKGSGGAGLGLAIAREIVEAHGGTIAIASESDVGTTVTVRLKELQAAGAPPSSS